jgi:hypothetical protein
MRRDTLGLLEDIGEAAESIVDDAASLSIDAFERDRVARP